MIDPPAPGSSEGDLFEFSPATGGSSLLEEVDQVLGRIEEVCGSAELVAKCRTLKAIFGLCFGVILLLGLMDRVYFMNTTRLE